MTCGTGYQRGLLWVRRCHALIFARIPGHPHELPSDWRTIYVELAASIWREQHPEQIDN